MASLAKEGPLLKPDPSKSFFDSLLRKTPEPLTQGDVAGAEASQIATKA